MFSKKIFGFIVLFLLFNLPVFSGPFGLDMGMTLDQLRILTGKVPVLLQDDLYSVDPPNKNDMFESYLVQVSPKYGVVWIKAVGKDITTNGHGIALRNAFNNLVSGIERNYGKYDLTDFLTRGSIWNEPQDWMMAIVRRERYLIASWERTYGSNLPDDILSIGVMVSAQSSSRGYVILEYYSPNEKLHEEEKKIIQDSVF